MVASRFNHFIVDRLVEGATDALLRHGAAEDAIMIVRVPGAWEIPLIAHRLALGSDPEKRPHAIIVLSAVIRGTTPHFDLVAGEIAKGASHASLSTKTPVSFGVLTTDTIEQAIERAGTKAGNKGWDAAVVAIEMVCVSREMDRLGL